MVLTSNFSQYWENLYEGGNYRWSLGKTTPGLLEFFEHPLCPKNGDVLVLGAGKGYDTKAWAERGYNVLAVDFCPTAIDALEKLSSKNNAITVLNLDVFQLSPQDEKKAGKMFDIIYDYCCFSSIHLGRRDEYIEVWQRMLKDDGILISFFYPLSNEILKEKCNEESYLFNISKEELKVRLDGIFDVEEVIVPKKSAKDKVYDRTGKEEIWIMRKII